MPGDTIIGTDENNRDVYILLDGEALVVNEEGVLLATLNKGDHFGEFASLMKQEKRYARVLTSKISQVGIFKQQSMKILFLAFPKWKQQIKEIAKLRARRRVIKDIEIDSSSEEHY